MIVRRSSIIFYSFFHWKYSSLYCLFDKTLRCFNNTFDFACTSSYAAWNNNDLRSKAFIVTSIVWQKVMTFQRYIYFRTCSSYVLQNDNFYLNKTYTVARRGNLQIYTLNNFYSRNFPLRWFVLSYTSHLFIVFFVEDKSVSRSYDVSLQNASDLINFLSFVLVFAEKKRERKYLGFPEEMNDQRIWPQQFVFIIR